MGGGAALQRGHDGDEGRGQGKIPLHWTRWAAGQAVSGVRDQGGMLVVQWWSETLKPPAATTILHPKEQEFEGNEIELLEICGRLPVAIVFRYRWPKVFAQR